MRTHCALLALIVTITPCTEAYQGKKRGRADRLKAPAAAKKTPAPAKFDAAAINSATQPEIYPGAKGSAVLRAQILLARAHFSCGEIDGNYGTNLGKAVSAYQTDHKLADRGWVDAPTWTALNADTAPPLIDYTVSAEDVAGPFVPIPKTMKEQATLPRLGYTSALEALGERVHSSPGLLQALNPGADFQGAGQVLKVPNVLTMPPAARAAKIEVSKSGGSIRAYDAENKLVAFYPATAGSTHDPLPIGDWKITGVSRDPKFHYNPQFFWDAKDGDEKAVIPPGPNNPVGLVWIDLSKEHNGIHGTPEPSKIGHAFSHGCIRLTNWDALELASMVRPGTPAILKE